MSIEPNLTTKPNDYPKPEAEYEEITQNPHTFSQKLHSLHDFYGTKLRVPTIGGHQLDLHQLFLEVTSRGGIDKVIRDRRWREVTAAFKFPSSSTNASFLLRKFYLSLLYHFEEVYYFRKAEPSNSIADQASKISNSEADQASKLSSELNLLLAVHGECAVIPNVVDGSLVAGTIDGKFDDGFTVTIKLGSEELKGVLYHTISEPNVSQTFISASGDHAHRTRRKKQMAFRDPAHPKPNRSGYTFFFAEQCERLRPLDHGQERNISKNIGQLWSRLTEAEKQVYQDMASRDKERYKAEMLDYKSSQHV